MVVHLNIHGQRGLIYMIQEQRDRRGKEFAELLFREWKRIPADEKKVWEVEAKKIEIEAAVK